MTITLNTVLYLLAACVAVCVVLLLFIPFAVVLVNRWQYQLMIQQQAFHQQSKQGKKLLAGAKTVFSILQALVPLRLPLWFRVASQVSQSLHR